MSKKPSSNRSRLQSGFPVPEFITAFLQADSESRQETLSTRRRPKEETWTAVQTHYNQKLVLQRLQTEHAMLLYALWDKLWLNAVEDCETLDKLPHPDLWRENALWRHHKRNSIEFMTGVMLDITSETPEVQLAIYAKEAEPLSGLTDMGWVFVDKWDEFTTASGLVPLLTSGYSIDLEPFDGVTQAAIEHLKTILG